MWYAERSASSVHAVRGELPNLVISSCFQAAWEKLFKYMDYVGHYDPVWDVSRVVDEVNRERNLQVGIHVDAASGGFIAPFQTLPAWDFRLPNVLSISASGHKYGESCCGTGWIVWRERMNLSEHVATSVSYLGGKADSYTLNFSRPASGVYVQYYKFLRYGLAGYQQVCDNMMGNAKYIRDGLKAMTWKGQPRFTLLDHGDQGCLPVVAARLNRVRLFFVEKFSPYSWAFLPADASLQCSFRGDSNQASTYPRLSGGQPSLETVPNTVGLSPSGALPSGHSRGVLVRFHGQGDRPVMAVTTGFQGRRFDVPEARTGVPRIDLPSPAPCAAADAVFADAKAFLSSNEARQMSESELERERVRLFFVGGRISLCGGEAGGNWIRHGVVREQRRGPVADGTCAVSDGWGCSAGTRALGGGSQYASMRRRPVAA